MSYDYIYSNHNYKRSPYTAPNTDIQNRNILHRISSSISCNYIIVLPFRQIHKTVYHFPVLLNYLYIETKDVYDLEHNANLYRYTPMTFLKLILM